MCATLILWVGIGCLQLLISRAFKSAKWSGTSLLSTVPWNRIKRHMQLNHRECRGHWTVNYTEVQSFCNTYSSKIPPLHAIPYFIFVLFQVYLHSPERFWSWHDLDICVPLGASYEPCLILDPINYCQPILDYHNCQPILDHPNYISTNQQRL